MGLRPSVEQTRLGFIATAERQARGSMSKSVLAASKWAFMLNVQ